MEPREYELMDATESSMWWYRALHTRLQHAVRHVRGAVLDAGCGTGGLLAHLALERTDLVLVGLEWQPDAARRAAAKSSTPVACGSVTALPFPDGAFDAAIAADVLCHAGVDPAPALAALLRALRPGGLLVINMPAYGWLLSAHDRRVHNIRRLSAGQLRTMLVAAGFEQAQTHYWNTLLLPLMIARRKFHAGRERPSDVAGLPRWLDAILFGVTRLERRLPVRLPAGGSVLATAVRP